MKNLRLLFLALFWCLASLSGVMGQDQPFIEREPRPLNLRAIAKQIEYPDSCKEKGIEGKVFIRLLITAEGKVKAHEVKKSPHPLMTKEVISKVYALEFEPAISGGKPVEFWVAMPFEFTVGKKKKK